MKSQSESRGIIAQIGWQGSLTETIPAIKRCPDKNRIGVPPYTMGDSESMLKDETVMGAGQLQGIRHSGKVR